MLHTAAQPLPANNSLNTLPPEAIVGHKVSGSERNSHVSEINEGNPSEDNQGKDALVEEVEVGTHKKGVGAISNAEAEPTDKMNVATTETDTRRLENELPQLQQGCYFEETRQKASLESQLNKGGERIHVSLLGDNSEQQLRELTETSDRQASSSNRYPVVPPSFKVTVEHLGNKAPLYAAGSNTTMSDPRPFDKQNFTDIGIAIENMRPPRDDGQEGQEGQEAPQQLGEAQMGALTAKAGEVDPVAAMACSPEFDPTEPLSDRAVKGPDSGVVMNIRSNLSSSQQVHLAFLDEEQRRKKDLAQLRNNMTVSATNVPMGAKPVKVSASAVYAEKGKKEIKAPNLPQLELTPPAPSDTTEMFDLSPYPKKMESSEFERQATQLAQSPKEEECTRAHPTRKPLSPTAKRVVIGSDFQSPGPSKYEMSTKRSSSTGTSTQPMGLTNVTVVIRSNKHNNY